jgi:hypothetical protein
MIAPGLKIRVAVKIAIDRRMLRFYHDHAAWSMGRTDDCRIIRTDDANRLAIMLAEVV